MKRVLIFVHFSKDPNLSRNVQAYLRALQSYFSRRLLVSNSPLNERSRSILRELGFEVAERENQGYDFYSWKFGLSQLGEALNGFDELVTANDSCLLTKNADFAPIFGWATEKKFWGLSKSYEFQEHLQSYFLGFKKEVFQSPAFRQFWQGIEVLDSKKEIIMNYELGLSQRLSFEGFAMESYFRIEDISFGRKVGIFAKSLKHQPAAILKLKPNSYYGVNPSHELWEEMIQVGVPLVKRELLTKNPMQLNLDRLSLYLDQEDISKD